MFLYSKWQQQEEAAAVTGLPLLLPTAQKAVQRLTSKPPACNSSLPAAAQSAMAHQK